MTEALDWKKRDYLIARARGDAVRECREKLLANPTLLAELSEKGRKELIASMQGYEQGHRTLQTIAAESLAEEVCKVTAR